MSLYSPSLSKCLYLVDIIFIWRSVGALCRILLARTSHAMAVPYKRIEISYGVQEDKVANLVHNLRHNPQDCGSHPTYRAALLAEGSKEATINR